VCVSTVASKKPSLRQLARVTPNVLHLQSCRNIAPTNSFQIPKQILHTQLPDSDASASMCFANVVQLEWFFDVLFPVFRLSKNWDFPRLPASSQKNITDSLLCRAPQDQEKQRRWPQ